MGSTKSLPVVKKDEALDAWLARAVPVLVKERGLQKDAATQLASEAWSIVNEGQSPPSAPPDKKPKQKPAAPGEDAPPDEKPKKKPKQKPKQKPAAPSEDAPPAEKLKKKPKQKPAASSEEKPGKKKSDKEKMGGWDETDGWGEEYMLAPADAPDRPKDDESPGDEWGDEPALNADDAWGDGDRDKQREDAWGDEEEYMLSPNGKSPKDQGGGGDVVIEIFDEEDYESPSAGNDQGAGLSPDDAWGEGDGQVDSSGNGQAGIIDWVAGQVREYVSTLAGALRANGQISDSEQSSIMTMADSLFSSTATKAFAMQAIKSPTLESFIEAQIHQHFTVMADQMRADGRITRDERIAMSNAVGAMLAALNDALGDALPQSVLRRSPWADGEQESWGREENNLPLVSGDEDGNVETKLTFVTVLPTDDDLFEMQKSVLLDWMISGDEGDQSNKGGSGSGNFGHAGRPGHLGGSAPRGKYPSSRRNNSDVALHARRKRSKELLKKRRKTQRQARGLFQRTIDDGGFTFEPIDDSSPTSGFAVSMYPDRELSMPVADVTQQAIAEYIRNNQDLWHDPENKLGGWLDVDNGIVYFDVSKVVDSGERAAKIAREYGQEGYFDLSNFETVIVKPEDERRKEAGIAAKGTGSEEHFASAAEWMKSAGVSGPLLDTKVPVGNGFDNHLAVKSIGNGRIGGYLCVWGDEEHRDVTSEWFSPDTDELFSVFKAVGKIPAIYHHGQDGVLKSTVVGLIDEMHPDEVGIWVEAQIRDHKQYLKYIAPLIDRKVLGWSSGTLPGARRVDRKSGKITRWPIVEGSLTPSPAEWRMAAHWPIQQIKAIYNQAGIEGSEVDKAFRTESE